MRELWRQAGRPPVEQALGISLDEAHRMRDSGVGYIRHVFPLVDLGMTRRDCQRWLADHGWSQVPKSACIGCPFHSDRQWIELRERSPEEWADAVAFDRAIRYGNVRAGGRPLLGRAYLHRSLLPLGQVALAPGGTAASADGFGNECEGMCGT